MQSQILENIAFWQRLKEEIEDTGTCTKIDFIKFSAAEKTAYCDKMILRNEMLLKS